MLTKSFIVVSIIVGTLVIAVIGIHDSAYFVGRAAGFVAAKSDTFKGHYELKYCDLGDCVGELFTEDPVERYYAELLKRKFGISYNNICDSKIQNSNSLTQGWYSGFAHGYFQVSYSKFQIDAPSR